MIILHGTRLFGLILSEDFQRVCIESESEQGKDVKKWNHSSETSDRGKICHPRSPFGGLKIHHDNEKTGRYPPLQNKTKNTQQQQQRKTVLTKAVVFYVEPLVYTHTHTHTHTQRSYDSCFSIIRDKTNIYLQIFCRHYLREATLKLKRA